MWFRTSSSLGIEADTLYELIRLTTSPNFLKGLLTFDVEIHSWPETFLWEK